MKVLLSWKEIKGGNVVSRGGFMRSYSERLVLFPHIYIRLFAQPARTTIKRTVK